MKKNHAKRLLSVVLAICIIISMLSFPGDITRVYAAGTVNYKELWCTFKDDKNATQYFYMLVPDTQEKYPVVVYFTGIGGCTTWSRLVKNVKNWVSSGYIEPVAIVMPVFNHSYVASFSGDKNSDEYIKFLQTCKYGGTEFMDYVQYGTMGNLIDRLKTGDFTNCLNSDKSVSIAGVEKRLDFTRDLTVTGFSMGGACALFAGVKYRNIFKNVGGLSPSYILYVSDEYRWDWVHTAVEMVFSGSSGAHLMMTYSVDEGEFGESVARFKNAAAGNGQNPNSFQVYHTVGKHGDYLAMRELFVYLNYLQKNRVLTDKNDHDYISSACGSYDHSALDEGTVTKAATCTEDGSITYYCSDCKAQETRTLKASGHSWDGGKVTKAATCTAGGVKTFTCTKCGVTKTETINAAGHKAVTDKAISATCTKSGLAQGSHCSVCGTVIKKQETVKASGHSWDGGKITKAPTASADGVKTYTCTKCKATKTEVVKASGQPAKSGGKSGTKDCSDKITKKGISTYNGVDYSRVYDYTFYINKYPDLRKAFGTDDKAAIKHFVNYGMKEGRHAKAGFDVNSYKNANQDLRLAFGNDLTKYFYHFMKYGFKEGRKTTGVYTVQNPVTVKDGVDYSRVYNYNYYFNKYDDLKKAFGNDDIAMLDHFIKYGMREGRQASKGFNLKNYKARYEDLRRAFGNDNKAYYLHYIKYGFREKRKAD